MAHHHQHSHAPAGAANPYLWAAMGVNLVIFGAELVGGLLASSLALVADSFHNLTDLTALLLVLLARRLQSVPPSERHTYGFRRADVLAGFANGLILLVAMGGVVTHALRRLHDPPEVVGGLMMSIGLIGLVANAVGVWLLHRDPTQDLGLRSAMLHLLADTFSSAAVIVGGFAVWAFGWNQVDPILSLGIAAAAIVGALAVVREGIHIVMEGTPRHLKAAEVRSALEAVDGVVGVEHLHLWTLASTEISLSATLRLDDQPLSEAQLVLRAAESLLAGRFGIGHTVLQLEPAGSAAVNCWCAEPELATPPRRSKAEAG